MGLRARPNNCVKSNGYDGPFLPSVTRRFGYILSLTLATSDHGRIYVRFPHMPGTDKGRREAQNVRSYHAVVCRRPCPISIGRHRRSGVGQLVPKPVAARANRPAEERQKQSFADPQSNRRNRPNLVVPRLGSDSHKQSFTKLGCRLQSAESRPSGIAIQHAPLNNHSVMLAVSPFLRRKRH